MARATDSCDVLIVGGGPAGSTCAWKLKLAGLDVLILDKKTFPRDKVCAGWVTPAVIQTLRLDLDDYARGRVLQPIQGFRTSCMGGPDVATAYNKPVSYGIRRFEFDEYLLKRCGARTRLGESIKSIRRSDDGWLVNDSIRAKMLVGAGGHFCPVARHLGAKLGSDEQVVAAHEVEFEMTPEQAAACKVQQEVPELFFCDDLKGYAWAFRKGDFLNVGLGREDNHKLAEHVERFCKKLMEQGKIPADIPARFKGHAYILYAHVLRKLVDDGVLLIGDAAGLAYPQSGEGIRPAVESAIQAADILIQAQGDYRKKNLDAYPAQLVARFGPRRESGGVMDLLPTRAKQILGGKLLGNPWFSRNVVIDRWFLHTQQSPLIS